MNYLNGCNMNKRRFYGSDFEKYVDYDNEVISMNDIKKVFREYCVMKMEKDFEEMLKKYLSDKLNDNNGNI
jgi:hypothetical protein